MKVTRFVWMSFTYKSNDNELEHDCGPHIFDNLPTFEDLRTWVRYVVSTYSNTSEYPIITDFKFMSEETFNQLFPDYKY